MWWHWSIHVECFYVVQEIFTLVFGLLATLFCLLSFLSFDLCLWLSLGFFQREFSFHCSHFLCILLLLGLVVRITDLFSDVFINHAPSVHLWVVALWQLLLCIHLLELFGQVALSHRVTSCQLLVKLFQLLLSLLFFHLPEHITLCNHASFAFLDCLTSWLRLLTGLGSSITGFRCLPLILHHLQHCARISWLFFLFFFNVDITKPCI